MIMKTMLLHLINVLISLLPLLLFVIGMYDGFYGPGTGTFLIIDFTVFAKLSIKQPMHRQKLLILQPISLL